MDGRLKCVALKILVVAVLLAAGASSVAHGAAAICEICECDNLVFSPLYHGSVCSGGYTGKQCSTGGIHTCTIFDAD